MKRFAQIFAMLSLALSGLALFRPKPLLGPIVAILLAPLKLLAGALTPLAIVLGGLGALFGIASRSPWTVLAGGTAAMLAARYLQRVTTSHNDCDLAAAAGWGRGTLRESPPDLAPGNVQRRWIRFFVLAPRARWHRDLAFWTVPPSTGLPPSQLLCDLWQPPRSIFPSGLAYIFFHGGGWHQFSKDSLTRPFFRHLAAQGHVVMDVAYRLHPEADLIGMVGDAKRAVAWMKANAERYGANPDCIVVAGGSAGGHMALLAAYTPDHPELTPEDIRGLDTTVKAVVASYPVVDLRSYLANNDYRTIDLGLFEVTSPREVVPRLVGGTPTQVPEQYDLLSPINHTSPECPPTLLLQAGHDHVVPLEPVRDLQRKLAAAGVPAICIEYPAAEHVFDLVLPRLSPAARAVWREIDRFLTLVHEA